jgi:hypothetical protein
MKENKEILGCYGSKHTPTTVFVYNGWYVCEGSKNINFTNDDIAFGVDVETLNDINTATSDYPIESLEQLIQFIDEE